MRLSLLGASLEASYSAHATRARVAMQVRSMTMRGPMQCAQARRLCGAPFAFTQPARRRHPSALPGTTHLQSTVKPYKLLSICMCQGRCLCSL